MNCYWCYIGSLQNDHYKKSLQKNLSVTFSTIFLYSIYENDVVFSSVSNQNHLLEKYQAVDYNDKIFLKVP